MPRSRITRAAAWAPKTWAVRLRRTIASQPASVTSSHSAVAARLLREAARVVDPDVDPAEPRHRGIGERPELAEVRDVRRLDDRPPPLRLDLPRHGLEVRAAPGSERHVGSLLGEGERDRPAEAAARAGDHARLAREREHAAPQARLACMACHTRSGRRGMSMCRTLNDWSASTTAFTTAGVEPIVAASPMPLAPSGFTGVGVTV